MVNSRSSSVLVEISEYYGILASNNKCYNTLTDFQLNRNISLPMLWQPLSARLTNAVLMLFNRNFYVEVVVSLMLSCTGWVMPTYCGCTSWSVVRGDILSLVWNVVNHNLIVKRPHIDPTPCMITLMVILG